MTYGLVYFISQREGAKSRRQYTFYEIVALKCGLSLLMDLSTHGSIHTHVNFSFPLLKAVLSPVMLAFLILAYYSALAPRVPF